MTLLSDVRQLPGKGIHALSTHICNLVSQCKLPQAETQEMLKIMVLQHAVCYYEARDWIHQQDQSQLTYQSLLTQCKLLESRCKQCQEAKEKGWADLTSITAVTSSASSIHADALTTFAHCNTCGYSHPVNKCPAKGQTCYAWGGHNNYTALCIKKHRKLWQSGKTQRRGYQSSQRLHSKHCEWWTSHSPGRQLHHHSPSQSHSPSHSASPCWSDWSHHWHRCDPCWQHWNHSPAWRFLVYREQIWWQSILLHQAPASHQRWHQTDGHE